jgi:hypothetical protein
MSGLSTAESYVKAGGAYLVGVAGGQFIDNFVTGMIMGSWEKGWSGNTKGEYLLNALIETSLFLLFSALVGPRLSANSQLLFTIGLFANNQSVSSSFGQIFGTWAYGKV